MLNGVAKTYAMTGWRVGWMIGPQGRRQGRLQPAVAPDLERRQRLAARRDHGADRRPLGGARDADGVRPPPPHDRLDAQRHPRRRLPDAAGRVLRLPLGARRPRQDAARPDAADLRRARVADPRGGRGRRGAGRGVRAERLPADVVRARRRRPRRGRQPDPEAAGRGGQTSARQGHVRDVAPAADEDGGQGGDARPDRPETAGQRGDGAAEGRRVEPGGQRAVGDPVVRVGLVAEGAPVPGAGQGGVDGGLQPAQGRVRPRRQPEDALAGRFRRSRAPPGTAPRRPRPSPRRR